MGAGEAGLCIGFCRLFRLDERDRTVAAAPFGFQRVARLGEFAFRGPQLRFHLIDLGQPVIERARRSRLGTDALQFVLELQLLLPGFAQAALERFGTVVLAALQLLHFASGLDQLMPHLTEFTPLRIDLRHGIPSGRRLGLGLRADGLQLGARPVEFLLVGRELVHRRFGVATVGDDLAEQGVAVADQVAEGLEPLQDGQVSGWSGGRN